MESEKGVGSIFTVSLPSATSRRTQSDSASHEDLSLESFGFEGNVLVVEDNTLTQQLITHQLGETCHVETASRPEEALEIARKRSFDLLLLDIHLRSEKNGIDVLHDLRTLPSCQDAPALALTAYAMPDDRERFLEAGFDRYLSKPFTQEQLVRTMRQALQALQ